MSKFSHYAKFNFHRLQESGISFGIHFSQTLKRIDIHFWNFIICFGKIPIHDFGKRKFAVSDSYHEARMKRSNLLYAEPSNDILLKESN